MNAGEHANLRIEDLLPHRGTLLLIEQVLEVTAAHARTLSTVRPEWPLTDARGAQSLICVELAAQTAGVCNGWSRIRSQGLDSDQSGWLVAVKQADFFVDRLPLGGRIEARAENTLVFDKFREVASQLSLDGRRTASVVLQLLQV